MESNDSEQRDIFDQVNRLYRTAARLQYTILQSDSINYDMDKSEELWDALHSAYMDANHAVELLKEMEE